MKVEFLGSSDPEIAIVSCVHGDELIGRKVIDRLKNEEFEWKKGIKLIVANEEACENRSRFVDEDLNRCFPGNKDGETHEKVLAAELLEELEGLRVLDIHSSKSEGLPFSIISEPDNENMALAESTGLERSIDMSYIQKGIVNFLDAVVVEFDEMDLKGAYETVVTFLANEGAVEKSVSKSEPEIYSVYGKEEGVGYEFTAENFEKVEEGEVFAVRDDEDIVAEEDFYPVLMSTNGYDELIGFKAKKLQREITS